MKLIGGTGIARRDVTIEVVRSLIEKEITGFGEIFRMLSYVEDIGSAAILSRAIAGVSHDTGWEETCFSGRLKEWELAWLSAF